MSLFKVTFNWYGEVYTEWTHAKTPRSAFNNIVAYMSKKCGYNRGFVRSHLQGGNKTNIEQIRKEEHGET